MENELREAIEKEFYFMTHGNVYGGTGLEVFYRRVEELVVETADNEWNDSDIFLCICYAIQELIEKEG